MRLAIGGALTVAMLGAVHGSRREAADVRVGAGRAIVTVLGEIGGQFEQATGHKLSVTSDLGPNIVKRIEAGEKFDVVIVAPAQIDQLIKAGRLVAATRTAVARSGIGVAVRAGAPKPDIGSAGRFKTA